VVGFNPVDLVRDWVLRLPTGWILPKVLLLSLTAAAPLDYRSVVFQYEVFRTPH
jgi:hypothetical protein